MHSFQPSRGRVLFEFLCALGIVASSVGAWKQTGASALLLAAFVAGLYGFVRLLDLSRPRPAVSPAATIPQPEIEPAPEQQADILALLDAAGRAAMKADAEPEVAEAAAEPVVAEASQAKPRRKGGRKPKADEAAKVVALMPAEEMAVPAPVEAADVAEVAPLEQAADFEDAEFAEFAASDETAHPHIAPLFEPEPFARAQRRAFGRRGRL